MKLLYIDLFCGAGGTSTGVENTRHNGEQCAKVIACVNHDAKAIASHAENHPDALHFTEDIRTLELFPLVEHVLKMRALYPDAFVVLWASLECTNFSKAKGGQLAATHPKINAYSNRYNKAWMYICKLEWKRYRKLGSKRIYSITEQEVDEIIAKVLQDNGKY